MRFYRDTPEEGEFVVVEIEDIYEHSVSAHIEGYDTSGLIHISEVSRSWVRDIRKEVQEGEKTVAQVIELEDGQVNLSLKRVNDKTKRETMDQWKKEQKADKFLQRVADELETDVDGLYEQVAFPFQKAYDSTFEGFERAATGDIDFDELAIDEEVAEAVTTVAKDNISLKNVELEGELDIRVPGGDGITTIRDALQPQENVEIRYVSAPTYEIHVWGRDTDDAKRRMDDATETIQETVEAGGGTFAFTKK